MKLRIVFGLAVLMSAPIALAQLTGRGPAPGSLNGGAPPDPSIPALPVGLNGPNVIVGDLHGSGANGSMGGPLNWGAIGGVRAYSIGTTACNIGDEPLDWYDFGTPDPTKHPVIAQNLYRLKDDRLEQIGMSWLKHAFCALQQTLCAVCQPVGPGCEDELGVGCSDPYASSTNGNQTGLGPRSEVNATTGQILVWPFTTPGTSSALLGRVRVSETDLDPALNPGARYFAEAHYVAEDDALAGNDDNNASYREVAVTGATYALPYAGSIHRMKPAIQAWADIDPQVTVVPVDIPGDGRFHLAWKVSDNGDGTWHYEYALHNMNSDRAAAQFLVDVSSCLTLSGIDFHGIAHHSGEPYSTADWSDSRGSGVLGWSTEPHAVNPDANALRWGTLFNFRFDADAPPVAGELTIGLFKPGAGDSIVVAAMVPPPGGETAAADCADGGDGIVDIEDLLALLAQWDGPGACDIAPNGGDGVVGVNDLLELLSMWLNLNCP